MKLVPGAEDRMNTMRFRLKLDKATYECLQNIKNAFTNIEDSIYGEFDYGAFNLSDLTEGATTPEYIPAVVVWMSPAKCTDTPRRVVARLTEVYNSCRSAEMGDQKILLDIRQSDSLVTDDISVVESLLSVTDKKVKETPEPSPKGADETVRNCPVLGDYHG